MRCYMIVQATITHPERFAQYTAETPRLVSKYGGKYLCIGRNATVLEGDFGANTSVVISVWPNRESIHQFWESEEYQTLKKLRAGTGEFNVTIVDDILPELTVSKS